MDIKKIEKHTQYMLNNLKEAEEFLEQLNTETDPKKRAKVLKKYEFSKERIVYNGDKVGEFGGDLNDVADELSGVQLQLLKEAFPYGFDKETIELQNDRDFEVEQLKKKLTRLIALRMNIGDYAPELSTDEKCKHKLFKEEKFLGGLLLQQSDPENKYYRPAWNYKAHFETSIEFTEAERQTIERCIAAIREYNAFYKVEEKEAERAARKEEWQRKKTEFRKMSTAKMWAENFSEDVFVHMYKKVINRGERGITRKESKEEAKECFKRFYAFLQNKDEVEELMLQWDTLKADSKLNGYSEDGKNTAVIVTLTPIVGMEKTLFALAVDVSRSNNTGFPIDILTEFTLEELGIE